MRYTQKQLERARIAVGLNPLDPEADPLPRAAALKAWHAKWDRPLTYGGGYTKAGGGVRLGGSYKALSSAPTRPRRRVVPIFSTTTATNHRQNNSVVDLRADGEHIFAAEYPVLAIKAAGVDRYGFDLVELETSLATYLVNRSALKG